MQLEGLDLLNCLITPLFFASTLARWPRSFLSSVYCMVLAIKGYQMALLLLPAARRYKAHAKARCVLGRGCRTHRTHAQLASAAGALQRHAAHDGASNSCS